MSIQELNIELAKHRKLLNRAVGNRIIEHINFHHYEIIRLIAEIDSEEKERDRLSVNGIFDAGCIAFGNDFGKVLRESFLKHEDEAILKGQFQTYTTSDGNTHNDIHLPK